MERALDEDLLDRVEGGSAWCHRVWEAHRVAVVLGRGAVAEREVRLEACEADRVPVLRRRGGGGAVVLGEGCVVVSLGAVVDRELEVGRYLNAVAEFLAQALGRLTGLPLVRLGTGDVCLGDRKVLGSSLFRRKKILFYQASLLHSLDLSLVERYLAHPPKEPEYRRGRQHLDFLTTLKAAGVAASADELCRGLDRELADASSSPPWGRPAESLGR